jgi:hypothetical protein
MNVSEVKNVISGLSMGHVLKLPRLEEADGLRNAVAAGIQPVRDICVSRTISVHLDDSSFWRGHLPLSP